MAFQVSPGVLVQERDLTNIIPAVSTSIGAVAGQFSKGPIDEIVSISSEQELVDTFGKPDSTNFEHFFTAANFLQYSNALRVVRAQNTSVLNASTSGTGVLIKNTEDYENNYSTGQGSVGSFAARTAGAHGNSLQVSTCPSATAYESISTSLVDTAAAAVGDTIVTTDESDVFNVGDIIQFSTTASTDDYDDGDFYRVTAIAASGETLPAGIGRFWVRDMIASMSASYHIFMEPDAPAPIAIQRTATNPSTGWIGPGANANPTRPENTTSDITRGFKSAIKSLASPPSASAGRTRAGWMDASDMDPFMPFREGTSA